MQQEPKVNPNEEPKVNPNEAPEGYVAVKQFDNLCTGCGFYDKQYYCNKFNTEFSCMDGYRKDKHDVIFIKKSIYTEDILESLIKECKVQDYMRSDIEIFASKVFEAGVKFGKEQANKELN